MKRSIGSKHDNNGGHCAGNGSAKSMVMNPQGKPGPTDRYSYEEERKMRKRILNNEQDD